MTCHILIHIISQYAITFYERNAEDLEPAGDSRALLGETVWLPDHEILLVSIFLFIFL